MSPQVPTTQRQDLGEFLRARRARLLPEDVGLPTYGGQRRVPGLRREELAQLAGVSAGYYTRLEQGQSPNASDAVLDAVARVLRLDIDERAHLYALARPVERPRRRAARPERARPTVQMMVESLRDVPALVFGRFLDILAWNPMAHALLAGHLDLTAPQRPADRPNLARMLFLDPHVRELFADWPRQVRGVVADLRLIAGRHPDTPELAALVGELSLASEEFARLWASHAVFCPGSDTRGYQHPVVGPLELTTEYLSLPKDEEQRVAVYTAAPGSASEAGLRLLSGLVAAGQEPDTAWTVTGRPVGPGAGAAAVPRQDRA
ncbi:helix-turn-helix domain-containing protein [Kitasatospora sp. NPDC048239]|uniref:helix-turn-helix domain-containing protein n=1 Tax=Kitasatospora sp. NPDC048239 TaxID=3364046 RepID=UPI00371462DE